MIDNEHRGRRRGRGGATILQLLAACVAGGAVGAHAEAQSELPQGPGLAALYPGDAGIDSDPNVVFVENFENGTVQDVIDRWGQPSWVTNPSALDLVGDTREGSAGSRSMKMTASDSHQGTELYTTFTDEGEGWEQVHLRYDVKFADDYPRNHHFVGLRGFADPDPYPVGTAGSAPTDFFSIAVEPQGGTNMSDWGFYAYWPNMRSWQTEEGEPDGRPNPYYGNKLGPPPDTSYPIERGEWITVEVMVKLNSDPSDPNNQDGELAFWIDGELAAHFAPGTPYGYWRREGFVYGDPPDWLDDPPINYDVEGAPFDGLRFRNENMEDVLINVLRLQNYVSRDVAGDDFEASVYFDNVVMATEYIGPVSPVPEPATLTLLMLGGALVLGRPRQRHLRQRLPACRVDHCPVR